MNWEEDNPGLEFFDVADPLVLAIMGLLTPEDALDELAAQAQNLYMGY